MTKTDKIINELFILARDKERVANAKIAAALVYKGKIISYGFNQARTSWMQRQFKKNPDAHYLHAEIDAIKNALRVTTADVISKSTLYVARSRFIQGENVFGNAKPCVGCQNCISWFNVKKVIYTTDAGTYGEM